MTGIDWHMLHLKLSLNTVAAEPSMYVSPSTGAVLTRAKVSAFDKNLNRFVDTTQAVFAPLSQSVTYAHQFW